MLQGITSVSGPDIEFSAKFLERHIKAGTIQPGKVIDCGGGIGRISKELLVKFFPVVDIVDQAPSLITAAKKSIAHPHMRYFLVSGLQDFVFPDKYDCIWVQWVLLHLTDDDAVNFLAKCKASMAKNGILVVKENENEAGFMLDKQDYSLTRSKAMHAEIFAKAGLTVIETMKQPDFPPELVPVQMYALK